MQTHKVSHHSGTASPWVVLALRTQPLRRQRRVSLEPLWIHRTVTCLSEQRQRISAPSPHNCKCSKVRGLPTCHPRPIAQVSCSSDFRQIEILVSGIENRVGHSEGCKQIANVGCGTHSISHRRAADESRVTGR